MPTLYPPKEGERQRGAKSFHRIIKNPALFKRDWEKLLKERRPLSVDGVVSRLLLYPFNQGVYLPEFIFI